MSCDRRLPFKVYGASGPVDDEYHDSVTTEYINVFVPGLGDMTITVETERALQKDPTRQKVVISLDFDPKHIDIITARGGTIELETELKS